MVKIEIESATLSAVMALTLFMGYGVLSFLIGAGSYQFEEGYERLIPTFVWLGMTYCCGIGLARAGEMMFKEEEDGKNLESD